MNTLFYKTYKLSINFLALCFSQQTTDYILILIKNFIKSSSILFIILILSSSKVFAGVTYVDSISTHSLGSAGANTVQDVIFNNDGTKMFVVDDGSNNIREYHLSTGYDISTASYDSLLLINSQDTSPRGIAFNNDGTKMFVAGWSGQDINEYHLTTGFDISTASYDSNFSVSAKENEPNGLAFNSDGTKMFVSGEGFGDAVNEYTLSTGFDVSTASYDSSFSTKSQDTSSQGLAFSNDGKKMFVAGNTGDDINVYTLSTGFDVSTASFVDNFDVSSQGTKPTGITFNNDGTKMFITDHSGSIGSHSVDEYTLTTGFELINTAPTLSSSSPSDGATSVGVNDNIVLTFSEAVDAESGNILIKKSSDNSTVETINVAGGLVSGSGSTIITINPSSTLDGETGYYITIAATAFDDVDSASYAGFTNSTTLNFTTVETTNPTLSSSTPADNATGVATNANIVLNFSEAVDAESGNITIKKTSDDSTIETIDVTGAKVSGSGGTEITINPGNDLSEQTEYYVLIDATAFDDNAGNSYAGISSTTALSFTTENSIIDPLTDKDVVGSIEAQTEAPKRILQYVTTPVINRMDWLRRYRKEENLTNQNIKFQFSNAMLASLSNVIPASIDINENLDLSDNWSYWSEGSISVGKIGDTSSSSSKDIDSNSITIGMDKKIDENKMYGYALRFGRDEVEVGTSGTSLDTNSYSLSIYGTFPHEDTKFLDTLLGVSSLKTDHIRKNGSNTLTGERSGRQVFGSINFSTKYNKEKFNITPNARIDLGYTELSNYSEIGTDALTYDKQKIETGMVSIGLRLDDIIQFNSITFKPNGLLEYGANFSPSSNATVSYVSDPNTDYTLSIAHEATHNIRTGLGFELIKENGLTIIANYERDQSDNAHSDTLYLGASYITNRDTEYAMKIDGSEDLKAGFDITKKINGFDLKFNANQSLSENSDQTANVSLSRLF